MECSVKERENETTNGAMVPCEKRPTAFHCSVACSTERGGEKLFVKEEKAQRFAGTSLPACHSVGKGGEGKK